MDVVATYLDFGTEDRKHLIIKGIQFLGSIEYIGS